MKIVIVIPCRNEAAYIEECIRAIYASELPESIRINVVVVDGKSDDGTLEVISSLQSEFSDLSIITNEKMLTPYAFNLGIYSDPSADFIQIVGARHIISNDYLAKCLSILQSDKQIWCVGGRIDNVYSNETSKIISETMSTSFGMGLGNFRTLQKSGFTDTVTSPMYPKHVFETIGYFDENLIRNQDDDFNFRVTKAGGKIFYEHSISLKYYVRSSFSGLRRQFFQYGYWKVYVNRKHRNVTTLRQLVPPLFVAYVCLIPLAFILGTLIGCIFSIPLALYLILLLANGFGFNQSIKASGQKTKTYLILHFSYGFGYLKGIIDFLILGRQPDDKQKRLSR